MFFFAAITVAALQVGPNPQTVPLPNAHDELRDRPQRQTSIEAIPDPVSVWLAECLDLITQDPARAHTLAQIRRNETSGTERILANHCLGLAATELQLWTDAVTAFGAARDETPAEEMRAKARFGAMAGNASLASGDTERAVTFLRQVKVDAEAAGSAPLQAIAATDLARLLVGLGQVDEALTELELATFLAPNSPESWLLQATLLRRLERLDEASFAINRAIELAPLDPGAKLEAGVIAVLGGRDEDARGQWQEVINLQPTGPAAETARDYLNQLGSAEPGTNTEPTS